VTNFITLTDQTADDFVVPAGEVWTINRVEVAGFYQGAITATTVNVYFYNNTGSLPGSIIAAQAITTFTDTNGSFVIPIAPVVVPAGAYWLSVQARLNPGAGNGRHWYWQDRTVQSNNPAAWQNTGGGFGVCTTWGVRGTCTGDAAAPDQVFRLVGTIGGGATATPFFHGAQGPNR